MPPKRAAEKNTPSDQIGKDEPVGASDVLRELENKLLISDQRLEELRIQSHVQAEQQQDRLLRQLDMSQTEKDDLIRDFQQNNLT